MACVNSVLLSQALCDEIGFRELIKKINIARCHLFKHKFTFEKKFLSLVVELHADRFLTLLHARIDRVTLYVRVRVRFFLLDQAHRLQLSRRTLLLRVD